MIRSGGGGRTLFAKPGASLVLCSFLLAMFTAIPAAASNTDRDPSNVAATSTLRLVPSHGHPSIAVSVSGSGFAARELVDVTFDKTIVSVINASDTGALQTGFPVPASASPGNHTVTATGRMSGATARSPFLVRTDWTEFHFDPAGKGENPFENVLGSSNVADLQQRWRTRFGCSIYSSPAVVAGMVFVGNYCDAIYGIDAKTGSIVWARSTAQKVTDSPAVWRGIVFVGSASGLLYALDAADGTVLWTYRTDGPIFDHDSPAVLRGVVYVGSEDHNVYALDAATGALRWRTDLGAPIDATPAVHRGRTYITTTDGTLHVLDLYTGSEQWTAPSGGGPASSPAVASHSVFVSSPAGRLYAFPARGCGASSCEPAWEADLGGAVPSGPQDHPSSPAVADGLVYAGSDPAGTMFAFRARGCGSTTCDPVWATTTGGPITDAPAVANGVVYSGSWDNHMYAFDARSGAILGDIPLHGLKIGFQSSPVIVDGQVFFGVTFGFALCAFNLPS